VKASGTLFAFHYPIVQRIIRNVSLFGTQNQFGFIRFSQLTLPEAVSIPVRGFPDNARVVHTEMISLFSCSIFIGELKFLTASTAKVVEAVFLWSHWMRSNVKSR
jgi:hypothetical protein